MRKEIKIEGMMCKNCVRHVNEALAAIEGASEIEVDLESGTARLTVEPQVTDDLLTSAITEEGYEVKGIKEI